MKLLPLLTLALCASVSPLIAKTTSTSDKKETTKTTKSTTTTAKKKSTTTTTPTKKSSTTSKTTTKPKSTTTAKKSTTTTKPATKSSTTTKPSSSKTTPKTTTSTKKPATTTDTKKSATADSAKKAPAKKASGSHQVEASEADQAKAKSLAGKMSSTKRASLLKVINKGTKAEMLAGLKGVGESKVQYLLKGRPYKTVDGLVNINGFGVKTLEGLFADFNAQK